MKPPLQSHHAGIESPAFAPACQPEPPRFNRTMQVLKVALPSRFHELIRRFNRTMQVLKGVYAIGDTLSVAASIAPCRY